jgi:energy-coupling factor transport system substrate-specific component
MSKTEVKSNLTSVQKRRRLLFELAVFPMLGAIMFCSKLLMEALPNIHLVGMLTVLYTVVFRTKALIPIYIYVLLTGLYAGFDIWWIPYLYIWTVLWAVVMILPKNMPRAAAIAVYSVVCGLHGFLYGTLYAPVQALFFGFDFSQTVAWIVAGFPFDVIHGIGNIIFGCFVYRLAVIMKKIMKKILGF